MRYKLVAVDVDGTLLNSQKQLSKVNREAIQKADSLGTVFCISTGRPVHAAPYFTGLLGIEDLPFILYNGAMVAVGPSHKIIFEQGLSKADAYRIMTLGMELGSTLIVWSQNRLYVSEFNQRIAEYRKISQVEPELINDINALAAQGVTKVIWYDDLEHMADLQAAVNSDSIREHINYFTSNPLFLEFVDKKCSKALALERLSEYYGIHREEIIAIGDGYNDLPMIDYAGLGIAMGNAPEEIRQKADAVTLSNDEDGVAAAIERYILSKE